MQPRPDSSFKPNRLVRAGNAGVALLFSAVLAGLLDSIATSALRPESARLGPILLATIGHFVLYAAVFFWVGFRQGHRPVIHAMLAWLLATVLALVIWTGLKVGLSLPTPAEPRPFLLQAIDWAVTVLSLVAGLGLGRLWRGVRR